MGTQNEVYAVPALEFGGFVRGADAAGERYLLDAARSAEAVEFAEVAADAVHGVLSDVAGVEDDEVGVFVALDLGVSGVQDHAPHAVRVVDVHLAAEGAYARGLVTRRGSRRRLGLSGELYYGSVTHTLPPARRRGPSRRPLRDGSSARTPRPRDSSPSPPA